MNLAGVFPSNALQLCLPCKRPRIGKAVTECYNNDNTERVTGCVSVCVCVVGNGWVGG